MNRQTLLMNVVLFTGLVACGFSCSDGLGDEHSRPPTTLTVTIRPVDPASDQTASSDAIDRTFWGHMEEGPGEPWTVRDDLGASGVAGQNTGEPSSLTYFWHVTDVHIVDEESPARLVNGDSYADGAYRMQEPWSAQFLEATIRTANDFAVYRKFDFALFTGDMTDNKQTNELAWFMAVMEGVAIDPDSGDDDDPIPGPANDPHDSFRAMGLDRSIPWYTVAGNHDLLEQGNGSVVSWLLADPTGEIVSLLSNAIVPTCLDAPWYQDESQLPARCYLPPKTEYEGTEVVPDENRAYTDYSKWIGAHFGTATIPSGHGYTQQNLEEVDGSYSVEEIVDGVPFRLVVIDTVAESGQWGSFTDERAIWLEAELLDAEMKGQAVVVAGHHTASGIDDPSEKEAFISILNEHPNVIANIGGHNHVNSIVPRPAPTGSGVEYGYWEIETSSLIDWPQQTRLIEIVDRTDGTGDIYCTMLDYRIPEDLKLLEGGRFYALFDVQSGGGFAGEGGPADRNAVLRFAWPKNIADKLKQLPKREVESFNFEGK